MTKEKEIQEEIYNKFLQALQKYECKIDKRSLRGVVRRLFGDDQWSREWNAFDNFAKEVKEGGDFWDAVAMYIA